MKNSKTLLMAVLTVSVLLRIGAAIYLGDSVENLPGTNDQISYHTLAQRLLGGHGFSFGEPWWPATAAGAPTAHWSFLYTFYLALVYGLFGLHPLAARLIQALLVGLLHPLLVYWLGVRIFNQRAGLIASGLTAFYPYFIYYTASLMTEPFFILTVLASLWNAIRLGDYLRANPIHHTRMRPLLLMSFSLGLLLGAGVLLRQLFLLIIPFIWLWVWLNGRRWLDRRGLLAVIITGAILVAMIAPFTIYNYIRFHRIVLLNTNSGYVFFWANHPVHGTRFIPILPPEMGTYLDLLPLELKGLNEAALDQALLERGLEFVRKEPGRYFLLSLSRIPAFFMFWPSSDSGWISNISRVAGFGLLLPFIILGIVRSLIPKPPMERVRWSSPLMLIYIFILFYTGIHLLTWALIRYRLPVDALFLIFAGFALAELFDWIMIHRQTSTSEKPSRSNNLVKISSQNQPKVRQFALSHFSEGRMVL